MTEKTIRTFSVTLVSKDADGNVVNHPPGTPVTLPAEEADSILQRFGGEVVATPAKAPKASAT